MHTLPTAICTAAPTTQYPQTDGLVCADGTGICGDPLQADAANVQYTCSGGYSGGPFTVACSGGVADTWTPVPSCTGMHRLGQWLVERCTVRCWMLDQAGPAPVGQVMRS